MYGLFIYLAFERVIIYEIDATPQKRIYEIPKAMDVNLIMRSLTILPLNKTSPITLSKKKINTFL